MRSLKSIFSHTSEIKNSKREILFEEGEWCMYRRPNWNNGEALLIHRCKLAMYALPTPSYSGDPTWVCGGMKPQDGGCGEAPPEKLRGLYYLYSWER